MGSDSESIGVSTFTMEVSIPQSGFYGFRPSSRHTGGPPVDRFNPSVGILWVQTTATQLPNCVAVSFQSLSRDSMGSDCSEAGAVISSIQVSIPQSGFYGFRLIIQSAKSINVILFQSLSRDSMGSDFGITSSSTVP